MLGKMLRQSQAEMLMISRQSALQHDYFRAALNPTLEDCSSLAGAQRMRPLGASAMRMPTGIASKMA